MLAKLLATEHADNTAAGLLSFRVAGSHLGLVKEVCLRQNQLRIRFEAVRHSARHRPGLMKFAGVDKATRSKTGVWKMQEWTIRHHVAGMDFAGVDKSARCGKVGQWTLQEWSEVNKAVYKITTLAEALMSAGGQSYTRIFTVDQTHFTAVVGCPCCRFRHYWGCTQTVESKSTKPTTVS